MNDRHLLWYGCLCFPCAILVDDETWPDGWLSRDKGRVLVAQCSSNNDDEILSVSAYRKGLSLLARIVLLSDQFQFYCIFSVQYHYQAVVCCSFQHRDFTSSTQLSLSTVHLSVHENPRGKTYVTTHTAKPKLGFVTVTQKVFSFSAMGESHNACCVHGSVLLAWMYWSQELGLDSEWEACWGLHCWLKLESNSVEKSLNFLTQHCWDWNSRSYVSKAMICLCLTPLIELCCSKYFKDYVFHFLYHFVVLSFISFPVVFCSSFLSLFLCLHFLPLCVFPPLWLSPHSPYLYLIPALATLYKYWSRSFVPLSDFCYCHVAFGLWSSHLPHHHASFLYLLVL